MQTISAFVVGGLFVVSVAGFGCKDREEQLQAEESKGNLLAAKKAKLVEGVGKALQDEGKTAAEAITRGSSDVLRAAGKGFDQGLSQVKLAAHEGLAPRGIGATRAAVRKDQQTRAVTVYVTLDQPFKGPLELRAYDTEGQEVGRSRVEVDEAEPTARYLDFPFDERTPLLTADRFELR